MTENAIITIEGIIKAGEEQETVSLTTTGSFYTKGAKRYICYKESAATGFENHTSTIKVWENGFSMTRFGKGSTSTLIIEKDTVNLCNYQTPMGEIMLDINGVEIESNFTDSEGSLNAKYSISAEGMLISENELNITVKEIKN